MSALCRVVRVSKMGFNNQAENLIEFMLERFIRNYKEFLIGFFFLKKAFYCNHSDSLYCRYEEKI